MRKTQEHRSSKVSPTCDWVSPVLGRVELLPKFSRCRVYTLSGTYTASLLGVFLFRMAEERGMEKITFARTCRSFQSQKNFPRSIMKRASRSRNDDFINVLMISSSNNDDSIGPGWTLYFGLMLFLWSNLENELTLSSIIKLSENESSGKYKSNLEILSLVQVSNANKFSLCVSNIE